MISRTSDGSVRPGVSCDTISVDTSSDEEELLGQPLLARDALASYQLSPFLVFVH